MLGKVILYNYIHKEGVSLINENVTILVGHMILFPSRKLSYHQFDLLEGFSYKCEIVIWKFGSSFAHDMRIFNGKVIPWRYQSNNYDLLKKIDLK